MKSLTQADSLSDKAKFYFVHDLNEKALKYSIEALDLRKQALGEEDQGVADLTYKLGLVHMAMENYEPAHKLFEEALLKYEKLYYAEHYSLAPVLSSQATCYLRQGLFDKAEAACLKAHQIFGKTLTAEHRQALEATYKLGTIQRALGKGADALKLFQRVLKSVDTPLGPLEEFKYLEAMIQQEEGAPELAEKAYKEAIDLFVRRRNLARLASCLLTYAEFLKAQGREEEAAPLLIRSEKLKLQCGGLSRSKDIFPSTLLRA